MHLGYFWLCSVTLHLVTLLEPWLCTSDMWLYTLHAISHIIPANAASDICAEPRTLHTTICYRLNEQFSAQVGKQELKYEEEKPLIFSCHHSSVYKYQLAISLD